LNLRNVNLL